MLLDENSIAIINYLREKRCWTTSAQISNALGIAPRSIRYTILKINSQNHLIESSNKGYFLLETFEDQVFPPDTNIPNNPTERKKYIFYQLVIQKKIINIDDLSEFLHISPITLKNSLSDLKNELKKYNLYLKTKQNTLFVIGKERDKQKFAVKLIRDEVEQSSFTLGNIQQYFHTVDLEDIKNLVVGVFSKYQYFLDDFSLLNYIIHLAVCIELNQNNGSNQYKNDFRSSSFENLESFASDEIIMIVNEIAEHLNNQYGTAFSIENIIDSSILMTTRIKAKHTNKLGYENLEEVVGKDISDLILYITNAINEKYFIDLSNKQLLVRFALHLKNTLIRLANNIPIQAIQFTNIKNEYPFLFDLAVYVSYLISNKLHYCLPENEIAYIALHLGVMIEQDVTYKEKLTCVIISTDYYAIGKTLFKKITRIFRDNLFIQDLFTNVDNYDDLVSDVDLVISTYPINNLNIPHVEVGPFLSESDISEIKNRIEKIKISKRKDYLLSKMEQFFKEDLCFFGKDFRTADDAIEEICTYMIENQYVNKTFKKEIYEHENIAPSSYGNVAIAHTFSNSTRPSVIAMSINPTPVIWGENKVNIIFIFSLNEKDNNLFKDIFKFMTDIISSEQAFHKILKATNFGELKDILKLYL